jgi:predicted transcriptional regulator with HTH domain
LIHSFQRAGKWSHETVDGNGDDVQDYREELRRKTASDVSVSNACANTPQGLQVFYRDESQGILLGAVKTSNGWVYEIVDGDKTSEGRTIGDVAFHLSATSINDSVFLLYDSVLTVDFNRNVTSGEVRLATRKTIFPEDWYYQILDGPNQGNAVAGFDTFIKTDGKRVLGAWLSSKGIAILDSQVLKVFSIYPRFRLEGEIPENLGNSVDILEMHDSAVFHTCLKRICLHNWDNSQSKLVGAGKKYAKAAGLIFLGRKVTLVSSKAGILVSIQV